MTRRLTAAVLLAVLAAGGCSKSSTMPLLHPVKGVVTSGGQPLKSAQVRLMPNQPLPGGEFTIVGASDEHGNFTLKTIDIATSRDAPGAPEGSYKLHIDLPIAADQSGGGSYDSPQPVTIQAGENSLGTIEVGAPRPAGRPK